MLSTVAALFEQYCIDDWYTSVDGPSPHLSWDECVDRTLRGKTIRAVLCRFVNDSYAQHNDMQFLNLVLGLDFIFVCSFPV